MFAEKYLDQFYLTDLRNVIMTGPAMAGNKLFPNLSFHTRQSQWSETSEVTLNEHVIIA